MARKWSWGSVRLLLLAGAMAGVIVVGSGCGQDDVEEALGDMSAASIEAAYDVDRDPLVNEWLNNAGQTLVGLSGRQDIPYSFKVIQTDQVNAFAAPYGHIYVTSGFLDFTETEDEVWMVLAHEIGHIVHRDSIDSFKESLLWGILTQIISGESETIGDIVGIGLGLLSLQYSRDDEYAADDVGTELSYFAGYDPHQGLKFFDRLMTEVEKRRPSKWEVYFMTHPPTHKRIERQSGNAELDEHSVDSLMHIAQGYLVRGQPARTVEFVEKGLKVDPNLAAAHVLLGEAHAMRGDTLAAQREYQAALDLDSSDYARTRLAALSGREPHQTPSGIGPAGQSQAEELLAELGEARGMAQSTRSQADALRDRTAPRMSSLVSTVRGINERLLDLADQEADIKEATQQLVMRGNASISKATEAVYVLEAVNDHFDEYDADISALIGECETVLDDAAAGEGNPEDIPALRTALRELKRATSTIGLAMAEAPKTLSDVEAAQSAAADVASLMEMIVQRDDPKSMLADQLRSAATHTQQLGVKALHAVNRAKRQSVKARGHALVARLNLLGTSATPAREKVYETQISHFLLVPEAQVRALRATGAGYGEAAMALAASRSLNTDPGHFMPSVAGGISPVGEAMKQDAAVSNANVLLKFLAASMEAEHDAELAM